VNPIIHLVKKAQNGDDQAFLMIFQHYQEDLYRMAYVYVKNQEEALDVIQEVAYKSFKSINTLKNPEYVKTWLIKITINCAINAINKKKKVVPFKAQYEEYIGSETNENIPLSLSIQDVMEYLQEDEKSVILLRFYHNYTFKEISQALEIPLGTAKSILYRALNKLRERMEEVDFYE